MPNSIIIHTDGSSLGNPGPGGWGVLIEYQNKEIKLSGGEKMTTNNRMEMQAIIEALKWIKKNPPASSNIELYSDSRLLINSINFHWKRKANLDLWNELDSYLNGQKVTFRWIKGHAGHRGNEICNDLAINAAQKISSASSPQKIKKPKNQFFCQKCQKETSGLFSLLPDSKLIRVDCSYCHRYIKFAPPSPENRLKAEKNTLLTKKQLDEIINNKKNKKAKISDIDLKNIKTWSKTKAQAYLISICSIKDINTA